MPMYEWKDNKSGKKTTVLRSFDGYLDPPTKEESPDLTEEEFQQADWERVINAPSITKGPNWGAGKGYW